MQTKTKKIISISLAITIGLIVALHFISAFYRVYDIRLQIPVKSPIVIEKRQPEVKEVIKEIIKEVPSFQ
jgi:cell division protein FtsL